MKIGKRWLYIVHRWSGIVLCLFMALWFVSGVVMMYVGYPKLTPAERLAHLPGLALPAACCVSPQQALEVARPALAEGQAASAGQMRGMRGRDAGAGPDLRLTTIDGQPYWLVSEGRKGPVAVVAASGKVISRFDSAHALRVAAAFAPGTAPRLVETLQQDIFTVSRALDPHRPLHRVALDDAAGTELYVSSRTGEVVRDADRVERGWNYLGSILHWLYPLKGELFDPWRADIIIYLSLAGTVVAVLGIWVGILRWRFRGRFASGSRSPYREGWMRWHHLSGLLFGLVTLTWIFSGLMSMNPWHIFDAGGARPQAQALAGGNAGSIAYALSPRQALTRAGFEVRELGLRVFDGRPYYVLFGDHGVVRLLLADGSDSSPLLRLSDEAVAAAAPKLMPDHRMVELERLDAYDTYYYSRLPHTMTGHNERRLPVFRARFDDPGNTWVHIDPHTAMVAGSLNTHGRVKRWLFAFLHSFDLPVFIDQRPLWDVTLILLSVGGFVLCVSGTVIGWRRLRRPGPGAAVANTAKRMPTAASPVSS